MRLLARHGVREYWLVDPDVETIEVYQLTGDRYVLTSKAAGQELVSSPVLPYLALLAGSIFPGDEPLQS
jgi:Uma2 family endonuclease